MILSKTFTRFAAICCMLTVITTLGIHLFFPPGPSGFEERVLLYKDSIYLLNRWWVIFHCLMVLIAMWGFTLLRIKRSAGFAGLGFIFIAVFAIAEITRQMYVLFYINSLREQYSITETASVKESLKALLDNAGLLGAPLFGLFILAFGLGNLFFGLSLLPEKGFSKILAMLLVVWSLGSFMALGNSFWNNPAVNRFIEHYNYSFQPLMRLLIAAWLWKQSSRLE